MGEWNKGYFRYSYYQLWSEPELYDALIRAKSIYSTMNAGYGSFSDYGIWRENYEERAMANRILENIKHAIWRIMEGLE